MAPSVGTELMNESFCWSTITGMNPLENVTYEFILNSPAVLSICCSSYFEWLVRWEVSVRKHAASLCRSYLDFFSLCVSLVFKLCCHREILIRLHNFEEFPFQIDQMNGWFPVNSSSCFTSAYIAIPFSKWNCCPTEKDMWLKKSN